MSQSIVAAFGWGLSDVLAALDTRVEFVVLTDLAAPVLLRPRALVAPYRPV